MSKKMLINASHPEENRVAIVVDGLLSELDIEIAGQEQTKGNIYKAVVVRVESGLQAAFVDYGAEKLGFLQIGEIHPSLYPAKDDSKSRPRINEILQRGQEILVQIVKEERGNKGAALTTNLSVPGRYMVLMPDSTTKGVSRKIQDDPERKKLKRTMAELDLPERMGYIVRTAGIGKEKEELRRDFDYLVRLFEGIVARKGQVKAPAQLYQESNLVIRSIRDYFSSEMDEVLIDDSKVYQETKDFFALVMPELASLVKQHKERRPIFSRYQIEEQIDALAKNQIPLPSGGSIVMDQTEALVAVDVNSGKMSSESGIEATASKTNLEAAAEVGRQLRLRDLGGLVVIDFIDMRDRKHIREVEQELRKALKDDKAKVTVGRISQFGLMEMSRQRLKPTLSVGSYLECPHCDGKGRIKSAENQAVSLLRQIHAAASKGHIGHIEATVPVNVANDLHNNQRQSLLDLERRFNLKISITGDPNMIPGQLEIELLKREKNGDSSRDSAPVSHANQIENALAAAQQEEQNEPEETTMGESTIPSVDTLVADSPVPEASSETDSGERKPRRRRRRRRRKGDQQTPSEGEQSAQQESAEEESNGTIEAVPAEAQQPATDTAVDAATDSPADKETKTAEDADQSAAPTAPRRRRNRRPARRSNNESNSEPNVATAEPGETAATADNQEVSQDNSEQTAEKPQRRSRRPRKPATESAAATAVSSDESESKYEPRPTVNSAESVKKYEPRPTASNTSTEIPAEAVTTSADKVVTEEKPKRAPRRTSKKATVSTPTDAGATTVEIAEKPKRKPRKTTQKAAAASDSSAEPAVAVEKPKRQPRKTAAKAAVITPADSAPAAAETVTKEEKPKRQPRKTAKKETASVTEAEEKTEKPAVKKARPAARKTTPKKTTETEMTPGLASEIKTPRRPRRSSTKASTEPNTEATASAPAEEKPKRRPGRPRKTVQAAATEPESKP